LIAPRRTRNLKARNTVLEARLAGRHLRDFWALHAQSEAAVARRLKMRKQLEDESQ